MSLHSPFTVTPSEAAALVKEQRYHGMDNYHVHLMVVSFRPVYNTPGLQLSQSTLKKLPRLINGIPLGAGRLSENQSKSIKWRFVEHSSSTDSHLFLSLPLSTEAAEEAKRLLKDSLVTQAKAVFGDVTVKTSLVLSQCLQFDSEFYINDIADTEGGGLHFHES